MSSPYLAHCDRLGELIEDYDATRDERVLNEIFRVTRGRHGRGDAAIS
jgi:hypothetical protein